jgi:carboxypeptidase-like protein
MRKYLLSILFLLYLIPAGLQAQEEEKPALISLSGIIYQNSNARPLAYVNIRIKNTNRGGISARNGFFSVVVSPLDTLLISSVGFKTIQMTVPDSLYRDRELIFISMEFDTVMLDEAVVYPWPTKEQFREAFLALRVMDKTPYHMMPIPGVHAITNPIPVQPTIMNPASLIYESFILKNLNKLPKRKRVKLLPKWE